jgi:hypothetical protein
VITGRLSRNTTTNTAVVKSNLRRVSANAPGVSRWFDVLLSWALDGFYRDDVTETLTTSSGSSLMALITLAD